MVKERYRYRFNPDSLGYDRVKTGVKKTVIKIFTFITATIAVSILYYLIISPFFQTPKERLLLREISQMKNNYTSLTGTLQQIEAVLTDIQQRDSNLYRIIFESEPVSQSILRAGFGGVNRYEMLEGLSTSELMIETSKRSDILLKQLQVQSKVLDQMIEKATAGADLLKGKPSIQPVDNADLSRTASGFGWRMHPIYRTKRFHEGIDFTAPIGTLVRATGDGIVSKIEGVGAQGSKIEIDHGNGYKTVYAHLDKMNVRTGQNIERGNIIGTVGNTGMSTAPHLHYEVHKNGKPVNPINYFYGELSPVQYTRIRELANLGKSFD